MYGDTISDLQRGTLFKPGSGGGGGEIVSQYISQYVYYHLLNELRNLDMNGTPIQKLLAFQEIEYSHILQETLVGSPPESKQDTVIFFYFVLLQNFKSLAINLTGNIEDEHYNNSNLYLHAYNVYNYFQYCKRNVK